MNYKRERKFRIKKYYVNITCIIYFIFEYYKTVIFYCDNQIQISKIEKTMNNTSQNRCLFQKRYLT